MGLDEQRAATQGIEAVDDLPGLIGVAFRIGADQRHRFVAEVRGRPDRTEDRMDEVGATARMRRLAAGLDDRQPACFPWCRSPTILPRAFAAMRK